MRSAIANPIRQRQPWLRWSWAPGDDHPMITALAVVGVAVAMLMAVFGLPPVDVHGPLHYLGIMDPLCGGTRAARYTMLGEWRQAWRYNPLGIVAVLGSAALVGRCLIGAITGRWLTATIAWTPRRVRLVVVVVVVLLALLEVRQQLLVHLLTTTG
ncbi:MAG TPA: DUF2752 domain-containing protein [Propionibacteriaceae bacterium]